MNSNGLPSFTAFTAAASRAAHLIVDHEPYIFADTMATALLGDRAEEFIQYHRANGPHPILSAARAQVTCRSRYTEDALAEAVIRGTSQYVILGAGLDSFAHRSALSPKVRVFDVDHPVTQEWKRRQLPAPENVTFVPVDFTVDSLGGHLRKAGFDHEVPALVSWLGVTMYLTGNAIAATLSAMREFAPGSEIVLDYMLPGGLRDDAGDAYADAVGQASAERGEPWLSFFAPDSIQAVLHDHGFGPVSHVRQRDMIPPGLWARSDSLRPAELSRIAHATVART
jgi:methyltransferase (TIGR00027 family)